MKRLRIAFVISVLLGRCLAQTRPMGLWLTAILTLGDPAQPI